CASTRSQVRCGGADEAGAMVPGSAVSARATPAPIAATAPSGRGRTVGLGIGAPCHIWSTISTQSSYHSAVANARSRTIACRRGPVKAPPAAVAVLVELSERPWDRQRLRQSRRDDLPEPAADPGQLGPETFGGHRHADRRGRPPSTQHGHRDAADARFGVAVLLRVPLQPGGDDALPGPGHLLVGELSRRRKPREGPPVHLLAGKDRPTERSGDRR